MRSVNSFARYASAWPFEKKIEPHEPLFSKLNEKDKQYCTECAGS